MIRVVASRSEFCPATAAAAAGDDDDDDDDYDGGYSNHGYL